MYNFKYIEDKKNRIDKYLFFILKGKISRQKIQFFILKGKILLNNKKIKKKYILKKNDIITLKKIKYNNNNNDYIYTNKNLNIKIHYEDNNILIINKKPGQIVHPGHGNYKNTLVNWLKYYYKIKKINNNLNNRYYRFGLLHRLDKETSGLLMIAKNKNTFNYIKNQFLNRTIKKIYIALIWGIPLNNNSIIKNYISRNKKNRIKMTIVNNKKEGKISITRYKVIKSFKLFSLIKCVPKTGRTHQIRVHFKHLGHPILNDKLYGGNIILKNNKKYYNNIIKLLKILPRHALHAQTLIYKDIITKKKIKISSKIPNDIKNAIKFLKNNF